MLLFSCQTSAKQCKRFALQGIDWFAFKTWMGSVYFGGHYSNYSLAIITNVEDLTGEPQMLYHLDSYPGEGACRFVIGHAQVVRSCFFNELSWCD